MNATQESQKGKSQPGNSPKTKPNVMIKRPSRNWLDGLVAAATQREVVMKSCNPSYAWWIGSGIEVHDIPDPWSSPAGPRSGSRLHASSLQLPKDLLVANGGLPNR